MSRLTARAKSSPYHHGDLKNALIQAGVKILSEEGVSGLSLRKVAHEAGVSHAAPYAHFEDKEALLAAISTEGYRRLYRAIQVAVDRHRDDAAAQLVEGAWAYVKFALDDRAHFQLTMSGAVENEQRYPALVETSRQSFALVVTIVEACQEQGVLRKGLPHLVAVGVWSLMHGFVSLLLENQIPRAVRAGLPVRTMLVATLNQMAAVDLNEIDGRQ